LFDLDQEVAAWSATVHAGRCRQAASVAELSDHLYCEIDRARAEGLSDEQAFAAAAAKLGPGPDLAAEHAKNRSLLGTACAAAARDERSEPSRQRRWLLLAHAILWAVVILASSAALSKTAAPAAFGWMLSGVLVPIWWASEQILRRALRRKPTGHRTISID
jgi:hypothetical protein